jgi:hypothetical protein
MMPENTGQHVNRMWFLDYSKTLKALIYHWMDDDEEEEQRIIGKIMAKTREINEINEKFNPDKKP